ncbi:hypothetical protein EC988_008053, partial [Linderina pennispora]
MDSEKTTLSENHAEYEAEIIEVLGELREAVFRRQPSDIYQFCATYFNEKLAEQREGLLELVKMNPSILDSGPATAHTGVGSSRATASEVPRETRPSTRDSQEDFRMRQASSHAWSEGVPAEAANGLLNPDFSFGAAMEEDETDEARDKFSRLVHLPPNSAVQPFAGRRFSVSAESMNPTTEAEFERKFVPKTESQKQRIRQALSNNFLFKNLDEDAYRDVVDAMEEKQVAAGQDIITQGGVGDFFYIVERGSFDIFVTKGDEPPSKVATAGDGGSFGELALMYNAPRAATVHATTAATLWALDRITFRRLLMERTSRKRRLYERFLETVPLLKSLEPYERQKIADAL